MATILLSAIPCCQERLYVNCVYYDVCCVVTELRALCMQPDARLYVPTRKLSTRELGT